MGPYPAKPPSVPDNGLEMDQIRGRDLAQAFSAATGCLEEYRDTVNALNVFPVPDGDTGTNMLLTMRSAVQSVAEGCPASHDHSVDTVSSALATGAFFGARGNSGVILSQFLKGFSDALAGKESLGADDLPLAFKLASEAAYKSVGDPVEGTMLTVMRMASEAVQDSPRDILSIWETAFQASQDALARTPEQLPVLQEAGVVDSGGLGVVVLIGGAFRSLSKVKAQVVDLSDLSRFQGAITGNWGGGLIKPEYLEGTLEQDWGFCTQFIISGRDLEPERVLGHFQETALSTVVVGDDRHIRVHIHVEDTGPALSYAKSLGVLSDLKIENMDNQNQTFAAALEGRRPAGLAPALSLLPVTTGEGLARLFRESGCAAVIQGGQTMNPSVQQILDAARSTGANDVIILPNNSNVVLAAEQAAATEPTIHVVHTKSVPQGVAALLAFNPEGTWQANIDAMTAAICSVASVEVTKAIRGAKIGDVEIAEGRYLGLLEGNIVTAQDSPENALRVSLEQAGLSAEAIVTLYYGAGTQASDAESVADELGRLFPGIQVDLIDGGQPHYHYLASVE